MKNFQFHIPTRIIFGDGKINCLKDNISKKIKNILLVTDKAVANNSGAIEKINIQLNNKNIHIVDEIEENPSVEQIDNLYQLALNKKAELIIGVGGGSSMDAAKGIALLCTNKASLKNYLEGKKIEKNPLPLFCIPTSSGTGSEVTQYAVFTDRKGKSKAAVADRKLFAEIAIIDPELSWSMPVNVIVNTGFDALTHCIEAYLSTESFELNDRIALHGIETIIYNLSLAANKDKKAMNNMAYASMLGGISIAHASTILLHIMAYPLTVFYNIPHGKANAILLPEFINFMRINSTVKDKVARLEEIFKTHGGIKNLINNLGISTLLSDHNVKESDFEIFAKKTIIKSDINITPAKITESDIIGIYKKCLNL